MDGVDLCKAIRQNPWEDYTYILILTALSEKGRSLEGMNAGADDYVTKPFDPDELAARLRVASRICPSCLETRVEGEIAAWETGRN